MNRIFKDKKNLILSIILILILILSFVLVLSPIANRLISSYQNYQDKNAELKVLEKKHQELKKFTKLQDEIETANQNFLKFIPDQQESEDIMVSLDALARQTSNTLPSFSVETKATETKTSGRIAKKNLNITLTGSFNNILTFIQKAEKLQRFNQINSLSVSSQSTEEAGNIISVNLKMTIFYKK